MRVFRNFSARKGFTPQAVSPPGYRSRLFPQLTPENQLNEPPLHSFKIRSSDRLPCLDAGVPTEPGGDITKTGAGVGYDSVIAPSVTGSNAIFKIVLTGTQTFGDTFWDSPRSWSDIFTTNGTAAISNWTGVFGGGFQYAYFDAQTSAPATEGSFSLSGNTLTWTPLGAVPEPTGALAGLLVAAGLLRRKRTDHI